MSTLRSLEREVVKKSGSTSSFKERWNTYRTTKYGEGNVPRNTMKKKQVHRDNADSFIGALRYQQAFIKAYLENKKAEKEAVDAE
jgi:hypothetical protein